MAGMGGVIGTVLGWLGYSVGLRDDAASANGSVHGKLKDIKTKLSEPTLLWLCKPSDNLKISSNSEKYTGSEEYVKIKEIILQAPGAVRVSFSMSMSENNKTGYAQIYVDGVPVGTEQRSTRDKPDTFTEDINGIKAGSAIQIWGRTTRGTYLYISNFQIFYDLVDSPLAFL